MSTVTVDNLITSFRNLTLDFSGVRWQDPELLAWANEAQVAVVTHKPTASTTRGAIPLVAGIVQNIPTGGIALLGITHNTVGGAVTLVSRVDMDKVFPAWPVAPAADNAEHYMVDSKQPKVFFIYPANTGDGELQGQWVVLPTPLTATTDLISIDDEYALVMLDYILYRAYRKESKNSMRNVRAQEYENSFLRALGVSIQRDITYSPQIVAGDEDGTETV